MQTPTIYAASVLHPRRADPDYSVSQGHQARRSLSEGCIAKLTRVAETQNNQPPKLSLVYVVDKMSLKLEN